MRYNKGGAGKRNAKRLLMGSKGRHKKVHQTLRNLDLLSPFPVFNTRKYTSKEYFDVFEAAAKTYFLLQNGLLNALKR